MRNREVMEVDDNDDDEDEGPMVDQEFMSPRDKRISMWVSILSGFDVVASAVVIGMAFSNAYKDAGVSLYCMGIQAISHELSSLMLMMRCWGEAFWKPAEEGAALTGLLRKKRRAWLVREQIGAIIMGIVMLLSAVAMLFKAFRKIRNWTKWYKDHENMDAGAQLALESLAWSGGALYLFQAIFRFWAAKQLKRSIVWHCFAASLVSCIFLLIMGFTASYQKEWSWKAEPIGAIILTIVTLIEGIRIVIMHLDDMDTRLRYDPRA